MLSTAGAYHGRELAHCVVSLRTIVRSETQAIRPKLSCSCPNYMHAEYSYSTSIHIWADPMLSTATRTMGEVWHTAWSVCALWVCRKRKLYDRN